MREKIKKEDINYRKRLYGIIRLREEIELEEAAKFLNISEDESEAILYDLGLEKKIQGKFIEDKFVVKSDIDNFLDMLDSQFENWKYEEKI